MLLIYSMYCTSAHSSTRISKIEKILHPFSYLKNKGKLINCKVNKWQTGLINHKQLSIFYILKMFQKQKLSKCFCTLKNCQKQLDILNRICCISELGFSLWLCFNSSDFIIKLMSTNKGLSTNFAFQLSRTAS